MIKAAFLSEEDGFLAGFRLEGHAGWAEAGNDIVCAAVSSAAYLTVNTITDVLRVTPLSLRVREGELLLRIEPKDEEACRVPLEGLKLHLQGLEEQYLDQLRVTYSEV